MGVRKFKCHDCRHTWELHAGTGRSSKCPKCGSTNFHKENGGRGGRGIGRGHG